MSFYPSIDSQNEGIRVIHLASGSFEDEIRMTLKAVHLIDSPPPEYEALSYVWGTVQCPRPALVNNNPFTITQNLDVALRHLRQSTGERVLWVDAVCINQKDDTEKSLQVQLMGTIYSKATKVTIWMGPAGKDSETFLDCIDEIKSTDTTNINTVLEATSDFFSRDWFTRTWVVQEFELASEEPYMLCGSRSTLLSRAHSLLCSLHTAFDIHWGKQSAAQLAAMQQWSAFIQELAQSIAAWCDNMPLDVAEDYQLEIATRIFYADGLLSVHQALKSSEGGDIAVDEHGETVTDFDNNQSALFPSVLSRVAHLEVSQPVDKIYGILGACRFEGSPILPDYSRPVGSVYAQAMAHIMFSGFEYGYPIWPVGMESSKAAKFELPSWVPDFSRGPFLNARAQASMLGGLVRMCNRQCLTRSMQDTGCCFPFVAFMRDYKTLYAGGVDMGTICESWPLWKPGCKADMDNLAQVVNQVQKRGISSDTLLYALKGADMGATTGSSPCQEKELNDGVADQEPWSGDILGLCQAAASSPARILFVTDNGHVGVTEGSVKAGDLLAGLFGINFPVILRGIDGTFKMVNIAHIAHHDLGHEHISKDVTKDDLLEKYGFSVYAIE